ncbi:antitoxin component YwqK of YwqJK toxin-antitoxin module [Flavobacterium arsenatis]|uniref:Antitoxin component YwqK of YwqJK toxin-antitoxin module n=1 Tax=Flavobacterium arsenatis TaxID=1484332 RepID=A0ABU1TLA5_9FLAO|nr:membrane-binding protein [Flavobacterium arsenatis]MDR6966744.1 antitoxin component YwqK of YwqJK toxin-antitoxin module [Flavobacterium arsenatis]
MKKYMIIGAMLITGITFAQGEPKHEVVGDIVKSTYYHENGQISQEGFYKNGKVHGQWTSFDKNGKKTAIANYSEGIKTGKWIFWTDKNLSEVDYSDSRVASVKNWKEDAVVNRN